MITNQFKNRFNFTGLLITLITICITIERNTGQHSNGAIDNTSVNQKVHRLCKKKGILVNVADTPDLCDFYMGGIVTKGNLKIGISTNGKSPTLAKRIRQFLEELLPEEINDLLDNLQAYRKTITGDFEFKVNEMNKMTKSILEKK